MKVDPGEEVMSGEAIVCFSSIDWDFLWQQNQDIMHRLAKAGNHVLFIENTGVRTPTLRDIPRMFLRLKNWWKSNQGFREQEPQLIVLSPLILPFPYSRFARWVNTLLLGRSIRKWLTATKRSSPILWTFIPTPLVNDIIEDLSPIVVVYYSTADFAASSSGAAAIASSERRLFRKADVVIATSRELRDRARPFCRNAQLCPGGVDFGKFEACRKKKAREPSDISSIPRPRFGYIGGIHRWIDFELLVEAARKRKNHHFILVGPEQTDVEFLRGIPNIHLLGTRSHDLLPAYIGSFDAGLIPYRVTDYTASVYPTKLNEYFAMGIPVIATALPEISTYNDAHKGVVAVAKDREQFISMLDSSLTDPAAGRDARIDAARRNDWDARLREMVGHVRKILDQKRARPKVIKGLLRRLTRRYSPLLVTGALMPVFLCILLRTTSLAWRLSEPLILSESPRKADAVVVLAGGVGESRLPGQGHEERMRQAIDLYKKGYAGKLILCSGIVRTYSELEVMSAIAVAQGVRRSDILLSSLGGGTRKMVVDADSLIRKRGWQSILLVSSPYHMKRASLVWKKQDPGLEVIPIPVAMNNFYGYSESAGQGKRQAPTFVQLRGLLREAAALAYYRLKGWI